MISRQQVEAFLRRKPGNDAQHRRVVVPGFQSEAVQQVAAAVALSLHALRGVMRGNLAVRFRVPLVVIHAVQDALQVRRTLLQYAFEPGAQLARL